MFKNWVVLVAVLASFQLYAAEQVKVIVQLRDRQSLADFRAVAQSRRLTVTHELRNLVSGAVVLVPRDQIAELERLPYVRSVRVAHPVKHQPVPAGDVAANVETPRMPYVVELGVDKLWAQGARGQGVVVAVIDTGIDYTKPELGGCLGAGCRVIGGYDFEHETADPRDTIYHGTPVASIIGGSSAAYTGIAPEVKFLAYRIGDDADILTALERAIDPNGDGDFSDRADIINASIGTGGNVNDLATGSPDDVVSMAVDNATRAGTLVVAAVGNDFAAHAVSTPAGARTALGVGVASLSGDVEVITSRGPNPGDLAIKPDVIAPGTGAWAVGPRGLISFGGTSAASPHAAGVAALLLSLHPDWTPERLKQALMNTARTLPNDDVFSQGAGFIRADLAAAADVTIDTPSLSLGLYPHGQASWTQTRTVRVTNHGSSDAAYQLTATEVAGATVTLTPAALTLPAGGHADVTVRIEITAAATPHVKTLGVGGYVRFTSAGEQHPSLQVPWAAVKASRVTITTDHPIWTATWTGANGAKFPAWTLDSFGYRRNESILPPGEYELFAWGEDPETGTARLVSLSKQKIEGDVALSLGTAGSRAVTLDARDEAGQPPSKSDMAGWLLRGDEQLQLPPFTERRLLVTMDPGATLLLAQSWFDAAARKLYVVPHAPVSAPAADVTLLRGGTELVRGTVRSHLFPANRFKHVSMDVVSVPAGTPESDQSTSLGIAQYVERVDGEQAYDLTVFAAEDLDPRFRTGVRVDTRRDGIVVVAAPSLRAAGGELVTSDSAAQYAGDRFELGRGVAWPQLAFNVTPSLMKLQGLVQSRGAAREVRGVDQSEQTSYAPDGSVYGAGLEANTGMRGTWRLEAVTRGELAPGIPRQSTATMTLDPARADFVPPVLTSLYVTGDDGRLVSRLEPHGSGALFFSAADYDYVFGPSAYKAVRAEAVRLFYRIAGTTQWLPLTITQLLEDDGSAGRPADGILWRADLGGITDIIRKRERVDLRIELADVAGNTATFELGSAFSIGPELVPKQRSVR